VALTGEGEARLTEFLEWAFLSGVDEDRLKEFRRIALELFQLADGGRINETHILHLIDQHSEGPGGKAAVSLIEDVGEQILRFQASRKASISTPPSVPMANAPSRPPRATTSQPFVPRPEERVAGELRPPVAVAPGGDAPGAVVSFATGSAPPPPPVTTSSVSSPPLGPPAPLLTPPEGGTRRSATLFRCWRCKVMVEADSTGACPRCGAPSPKVSSAPLNVVKQPVGRGYLLAAAVVAVGVVALVATPRILDRLHHPSDPVAGEFHSPHLGVRLLFPDDWRHLREADRAPTANLDALAEVFADALSIRSSRFFRGAPGNPAAELYLVVGARTPALTDGALATWNHAASEHPEWMSAPVAALTGVGNIKIFQCNSGASVPHSGLRCSGAAGHTSAMLYIWAAKSTVDLALVLSEAGPEATLAESSDLVSGLDTGT
jgi:hypothetical protein